MQTSRRERLLITVLTYPHPSTKYQETVCTAGITDDGRWVRLYPVPLRSLPMEQRLRKWHWIDVDTIETSNDVRPESRRPILESIQLVKKLDPVKDREERRRLIDLLPPIPSPKSGPDREHFYANAQLETLVRRQKRRSAPPRAIISQTA